MENNQNQNCPTYEQVMKSKNPMDCGSLIPETDKAVLDEIHARYPQRCVDCICYSLDADERKIIFSDEAPEMRDYCAFSRLKVMSEEEAEEHDCYDALSEYQQEFRRLNFHWAQREKNFLAENLRKTLGKEPTEDELNLALINEINRPGKSQAERFRVYYAVAFNNRVHKVRKTKKEREAAQTLTQLVESPVQSVMISA